MNSEDRKYLLKKLISIPSFSREEDGTASLIFDYLREKGAMPRRFRNNIWAVSDNFTNDRPTLLLNSHHDTVRPAASYTRDSFSPEEHDGAVYGLGANDAGASVVALISTFLNLSKTPLPFNLLLAITAEEEVGGENGMRAFLPMLEENGIKIDCAIVGEPTEMQPAIAERGLIVLDCVTKGVAGHAARGEGVNSIYRAIEDIATLRSFSFPKVSEVLGDIGVSITQINAGRQHNVVPDECRWVVDVRTTDAFSNEQTASMLQDSLKWTVATPRSTRVRASVIDAAHPLVVECKKLGLTPFVSPTTSDMSLMHSFPSLKIGPGNSQRSHRADEFVMLEEIEDGVKMYNQIITHLNI